MKYLLTKIRWIRIFVSSILVIVFSFLVVTLITSGYAFVLAFNAQGKPDSAEISHFATTISRWLMPLLEMFFTLIIVFISAKKIENNISFHGLLIGVLAGIFSALMKIAFGGQHNYRTYVFLLTIIGIGYIGGYLNQRKRANKTMSPV